MTKNGSILNDVTVFFITGKSSDCNKEKFYSLKLVKSLKFLLLTLVVQSSVSRARNWLWSFTVIKKHKKLKTNLNRAMN